jgi:hypothetical protein
MFEVELKKMKMIEVESNYWIKREAETVDMEVSALGSDKIWNLNTGDAYYR